MDAEIQIQLTDEDKEIFELQGDYIHTLLNSFQEHSYFTGIRTDIRKTPAISDAVMLLNNALFSRTLPVESVHSFALGVVLTDYMKGFKWINMCAEAVIFLDKIYVGDKEIEPEHGSDKEKTAIRVAQIELKPKIEEIYNKMINLGIHVVFAGEAMRGAKQSGGKVYYIGPTELMQRASQILAPFALNRTSE